MEVPYDIHNKFVINNVSIGNFQLYKWIGIHRHCRCGLQKQHK